MERKNAAPKKRRHTALTAQQRTSAAPIDLTGPEEFEAGMQSTLVDLAEGENAAGLPPKRRLALAEPAGLGLARQHQFAMAGMAEAVAEAGGGGWWCANPFFGACTQDVNLALPSWTWAHEKGLEFGACARQCRVPAELERLVIEYTAAPEELSRWGAEQPSALRLLLAGEAQHIVHRFGADDVRGYLERAALDYEFAMVLIGQVLGITRAKEVLDRMAAPKRFVSAELLRPEGLVALPADGGSQSAANTLLVLIEQGRGYLAGPTLVLMALWSRNATLLGLARRAVLRRATAEQELLRAVGGRRHERG